MKKLIYVILAGALALGAGFAIGQSPYTATIFTPGIVMTASAQTSAAVPLGTSPNNRSNGYAVGTVTLTGSSLTTATFGLLGSADGGKNYFPLAISAVATPGTSATTMTATANGLYRVNLSGLTHIKYVTSGTFTATSITLLLTATPTGIVSRLSGGGPITYIATTFNEASSGNLAGTSPACCNSVGPWTLASGTDFTYTGLNSVTSTTSNTVADLIDSGAANGVLRVTVGALFGQAEIWARTTNATNTILLFIDQQGAHTATLYDYVGGVLTQLGTPITGLGGVTFAGTYTFTFTGNQISVSISGTNLSGSICASGCTTSNTGTEVGFYLLTAGSMTLTSFNVASQ